VEIVTDSAPLAPPAAGSAVTIGAYDGVHLGHRALLAELKTRAEANGLATVVVTFDRHPAAVVRPESAPLLLCDLDQKLELLASAGVDRTVVVRFDEERANESAEEFVTRELVEGLDARLVVVGEDFHFGHGRKGNVALLTEMGSVAGFAVDGVALSSEAGAGGAGAPAVSSTRVRTLVSQGDVEGASKLLGRPHQVRGPVVTGDRRGGAELGFPTANIAVPAEVCLPAPGIYAGWYERPDGSRFRSAASVGRRPTFYGADGELLVEAFLLDFSGDLYGEPARLSFVHRLRDELAFDSVDELVAQMGRDVERTRSLLTH
jgi:riboflavin kinase/FMN adenylyltransferase